MRLRRDPETRLARAAAGCLVLVACVAVAAAFARPGRPASVPAYPAALAVCEVFGDRYCGPALRVAWCESRLDVKARNGQFRGLFQMGAGERRRWGHAGDPWTQASAAYRYFLASGRDWSPWVCKP